MSDDGIELYFSLCITLHPSNKISNNFQNFEITFSPFAHRVKKWGVMKIAVLSCFDGENRQTCSKEGAARFPTLKIFPPKSKGGNDEDVESLIIAGKDVFNEKGELDFKERYLVHRLINVMIDRIIKFQKEKHSDWRILGVPDLTLHKDITAIKDLAILEKNEGIDIDQTFTPAAVILDLSAVTTRAGFIDPGLATNSFFLFPFCCKKH